MPEKIMVSQKCLRKLWSVKNARQNYGQSKTPKNIIVNQKWLRKLWSVKNA
jgi:hypothetical protein